MQFITNKISTGKAKTFEELVSAYVEKKNQAKTADASQAIKTAQVEVVEASGRGDASAGEKDEAESSGQLDVEPLHQEGESTPSPHKDKTECSADSEVKQADVKMSDPCEDECDSSGHPEWEGKDEHNNDPEAGRHREGDGDQKEAAGEAEVKKANLDNLGDKKAKPFGKEEKEEEEEEVKASADSETKEAASKKTAGCDCGPDCDCPGKAGGDCECKSCHADTKKDVKEAVAAPKFVKVSDLNDKSKSWLRDYWRNIFPDAYVDAMLADK